jgi:hypothetical protein
MPCCAGSMTTSGAGHRVQALDRLRRGRASAPVRPHGSGRAAGRGAFRALMRQMRDAGSMADYARRWLRRTFRGRRCAGAGTKPCPACATAWRLRMRTRRLPWVGPGMKPRMFATARQMETWAHGWEVYDLLGCRAATTTAEEHRHHRRAHLRLDLQQSRLAGPGDPPPTSNCAHPIRRAVVLERPRARQTASVADAVAFCQVVTQVRHVDDTTSGARPVARRLDAPRSVLRRSARRIHLPREAGYPSVPHHSF